jgi:hypothetical protein
MVELSIAFGVIALLALASVWADKRFRGEERLPMQWSFAGKVNWTAPRRLALAFTPTLGGLILAVTALLVLSGSARQGQKYEGAPVIVLLGIAFLGAHALHLWLIDRSVR